MIYDAKLVNYLQREALEIILFDDNAPITGIERGAQSAQEQADDMIGTAVIPLGDLMRGASIHDRFPVRKNPQAPASESAGTIEVKISIIDLDFMGTQPIGGGGLAKTAAAVSQLHYSLEWQRDLIYRIAKKLARLPGDVEMLFGVFSRGQRTVTKEDFKYTCLRRLQLSKDITERELDLFLRGCGRLADREIITLEDFLMLFSAEIT